MDDTRVDDIALFFSHGDQKYQVWVSHNIYTDPDFAIGKTPARWKGAAVLQEAANGSPPYYVANLATLNGPGMPPEAIERARSRPKAPPFLRTAAHKVPQAGDLVVIPWKDENTAYLVPRDRYIDQAQCPPIPGGSGADLRFMALTEGVVLANVPKTDPQGMTCYLLNLDALRAPAPGGHARAGQGVAAAPAAPSKPRGGKGKKKGAR